MDLRMQPGLTDVSDAVREDERGRGLDSGLSWLEEHVDRMVAELDQLVRVDTTFPPGRNYPAFTDLVEELIDDLGGERERITVPSDLWRAGGADGDRVNLLARIADSNVPGPPVQIYFHSDTAPVGEGWSRPALNVTEENGWVYGRGTADMKGAMAAVFLALRAFKASGARMRFCPTLLFCTDEEGGLHPGIRYLAEQGRLSGVLLNLNGSAVPRIWAGCFGSIDFEVRLIGRGAHSGAPAGGINAVEEALGPIEALMELKAGVEQRVSSMPSRDIDQPLHARLAITALRAGDKGSAWPGELKMIVNRRYAPEEDYDDVVAEIRDVIDEAVAASRLIGHEVSVVGHLPPVVDPDGPETKRWAVAQSMGFGQDLDGYQRFGSTTSSDFGWVQKAGINHILLGGLSRPGRNVHGPDEHTTRSDLLGLARSVFLFLADEFQPSPT